MQARSWSTGAYLVGPTWELPAPATTLQEGAADHVMPPEQGLGCIGGIRGSLVMSRPSQAGQPATLSFTLGSLIMKKAGSNPAPVELTLLPLSESNRKAGNLRQMTKKI